MNKCLSFVALALMTGLAAAENAPFRPPAVPLVANDPYMSLWSESDALTGDVTRHWTGQPVPMTSLIRIDGICFRLMGPEPKAFSALPQTGLRVTPTRSIYEFEDAHVHVTLTFMSPLLPGDLDVLARPVTYLSWSVRSADGKPHDVSIYDSVSTALAVQSSGATATWERAKAGDLIALKCGATLQTLFDPRGAGVRINWGYAYLAAPTGQAHASIGQDVALAQAFASDGALPTQDDAPPAPTAAMAIAFDLGPVEGTAVERHVILAYDELYAIEFSGEKLLPYWKRDGATMADLLPKAEADYPALVAKCAAFDESLTTDLARMGGDPYAQICALAYRQSLGACGLAADANKQPLLFTKENTSNGDIATVDVIFPTAPIFLFLSPALAKASLAPVFIYAASDRWKFPNAPHDLGVYPVASATGAAGEAMVVEESGNMLILCDAIAKAEGNADFSAAWWPKLSQWADYLKQYGLDPENQLCTDDFMGHLAHNSNLSVKAIVALAAYGDLCHRRGAEVTAKQYTDLAAADAQSWMKNANDGDHYRLAFDKPGTWSQLYNLAWDRILGLHVFPPEVAQKEIAYYKKQMQPYGLPLDSRTKLTKTDWTFWTATLADDAASFESFITPVYHYLNQTTARLPLADSYQTERFNHAGMHARSVVGGLFIKMLTDEAVWQKWAAAGDAKVGPWAPLHPLPKLSVVVPADEKKRPILWHYTIRDPGQGWINASFDDSKWDQGRSNAWKPVFDPKADPKKKPKVPDVWMRAHVTLPLPLPPNFDWILAGNSDGEIYLNGIRAGTTSNHGNAEPQEIYADAAPALQPGNDVLVAVHINNPNVALYDVKLGTAEAQ